MLLMIVLSYMAILPYHNARQTHEIDEYGNIVINKIDMADNEVNDYYNEISLFMVKPICAILLHINM